MSSRSDLHAARHSGLNGFHELDECCRRRVVSGCIGALVSHWAEEFRGPSDRLGSAAGS